jgi:hypothetical protein
LGWASAAWRSNSTNDRPFVFIAFVFGVAAETRFLGGATASFLSFESPAIGCFSSHSRVCDRVEWSAVSVLRALKLNDKMSLFTSSELGIMDAFWAGAGNTPGSSLFFVAEAVLGTLKMWPVKLHS